MRNQRDFRLEFKRQVVEELLTGESRPAQICRRYNIYSSVLYHWKKQYSRGKFNTSIFLVCRIPFPQTGGPRLILLSSG